MDSICTLNVILSFKNSPKYRQGFALALIGKTPFPRIMRADARSNCIIPTQLMIEYLASDARLAAMNHVRARIAVERLGNGLGTLPVRVAAGEPAKDELV